MRKTTTSFDSCSIVSKAFSEICEILKTKFGAEGSGHTELTRSIEGQIPKTLGAAIRQIGRIRNRVIDNGSELRDPRQFQRDSNRVVQDLIEIGQWRQQEEKSTASKNQYQSHRTKVLRKLIDQPDRLVWYACNKCNATGRHDTPAGNALIVKYCEYCDDGRVMLCDGPKSENGKKNGKSPK